MSKQEETYFLVKLFGGFCGAFFLFLVIVNLPQPGDYKSPQTVSRAATPKPTPVRSYRNTVSSTPSRTYKSNYGTSSKKLGGASNPFTQADGYNEEDALIYGILKANGYSHEDSARAVINSAW